MTRTPSSPTDRPMSTTLRCLDVAWTGRVTAWTDQFDACADAGTSSAIIAIVVALEMSDDERGHVTAWVETSPERRQAIVGPTVAEPSIVVIDDHWHIDVRNGDGERVLAVTIDSNGRLVFAQTTLLRTVGLGGRLDPPTLRRFEHAETDGLGIERERA